MCSEATKLAQGLPRSCPNSPPGTVGLRRKRQTPPLDTFYGARFALESHLLTGVRACSCHKD